MYYSSSTPFYRPLHQNHFVSTSQPSRSCHLSPFAFAATVLRTKGLPFRVAASIDSPNCSELLSCSLDCSSPQAELLLKAQLAANPAASSVPYSMRTAQRSNSLTWCCSPKSTPPSPRWKSAMKPEPLHSKALPLVTTSSPSNTSAHPTSRSNRSQSLPVKHTMWVSFR